MVARARAGQGPRGADLEGRSGIMSASREAMLGKIREALRDVPRAERPEDVAIDRSYRPDDRSPREALIEQFIDRVSEYKAAVRKVAPADLPRAIAEACAARGVKRLVVPADLPGAWVP